MAQLVRDPPRMRSVVSLRLSQIILLPKILTIKQFICRTKFQNNVTKETSNSSLLFSEQSVA